MRKSYMWKDHAKDTIKKMSEMQITSSLGLHCHPEEYLETLEDYTKLLFDMNDIPINYIEYLAELDNCWSSFKLRIKEYC